MHVTKNNSIDLYLDGVGVFDFNLTVADKVKLIKLGYDRSKKFFKDKFYKVRRLRILRKYLLILQKSKHRIIVTST